MSAASYQQCYKREMAAYKLLVRAKTPAAIRKARVRWQRLVAACEAEGRR